MLFVFVTQFVCLCVCVHVCVCVMCVCGMGGVCMSASFVGFWNIAVKVWVVYSVAVFAFLGVVRGKLRDDLSNEFPCIREMIVVFQPMGLPLCVQ